MSSDINAYKLPVCDVDTEYRNFPGVAISVLSGWEEVSESGTTDTGPGAEGRNEGNAYDGFLTGRKNG